jgi:hypothetical protein
MKNINKTFNLPSKLEAQNQSKINEELYAEEIILKALEKAIYKGDTNTPPIKINRYKGTKIALDLDRLGYVVTEIEIYKNKQYFAAIVIDWSEE